MALRYILLIWVFLIAISCQQEKEKTQRNVLFILADDLGYHDLSIMGSDYYETPNIDRIASEGTIFTQGYACSGVCSPSRASIMTGQFTARHGITDWIGAKTGEEWSLLKRQTQLLPPNYVHNLKQEDITLSETLQSNGYKTFFAGKWHLGSEGSHPEDHGFDYNIGGWHAGSPIGGYFSPYKNPQLQNEEDGVYLPHRLARETTKFLDSNSAAPFFVFLSFYAVHGPNQTTKEKWKKYKNKAVTQGVQEDGFIMEKRLPLRTVQDNPIYAGMVEGMDEAVGMVLEKLEELDLLDNTMIVFTSDNGGVASGDSYSTSNLPLRGGKGYQWEGGIREPYFISIPWIEDQPAQDATAVTGADFYPSILDALDIDRLPANHIDGESLIPLMKGKTIATRPLYWHYPHYGNQGGDPTSIIRDGQWKLIHYWEDNHNELYDLNADPNEANDLAKTAPDMAQKLWAKLDGFLVSVDAQRPTKDPNHDRQLENNKIESIRNILLPQKEKQRKLFLSDDYSPNEDWWGSEIDD